MISMTSPAATVTALRPYDPFDRIVGQRRAVPFLEEIRDGIRLGAHPDRLENMVLVCPNHHSAIHKCDAVFDYADMAFVFPKYRGVLQINRHI